MSPRLTSSMFWFCFVGAQLDFVLLTITSKFSALRPASGLFLLAMASFAVGAFANYFALKQQSRSDPTKR